MKCAQSRCERDAEFLLRWPGREPKPVCADCLDMAEGIAIQMHIPIGSEPIKELTT